MAVMAFWSRNTPPDTEGMERSTSHHIRDATLAEDACQVRTGTAPEAHRQPAQLRRRHPAATAT
jgi:hypothetical protein